MVWTINGRFLTQRTTGVQRYAREIVSAMDAHIASLEGRQSDFRLLVSKGAETLPALRRIETRRIGERQGHLWEQLSLPSEAQDGLISLCNTGPIAVARQIVCIHDANVWTFPSSYSRAFRLAYRTLLPILGRRARKILTVSRSSADALIALGIAPAGKIEIVPNGYEHVLRWDSHRSRLFDALPAERRPFVFALGSRAPHKNVGLLLKIAPKLDELGLDLYLSGGTSSIFSTQGARTTALPANVRMLGYVSDDDLALLYERALCLAFPSFVEGFGLPLVEAMAFGCPIVCSNTSCMPEICGDDAVYAGPDDPDAWVKAFRGLIVAKQTREMADIRPPRFSWMASAAKLDEIVSQFG